MYLCIINKNTVESNYIMTRIWFRLYLLIVTVSQSSSHSHMPTTAICSSRHWQLILRAANAAKCGVSSVLRTKTTLFVMCGGLWGNTTNLDKRLWFNDYADYDDVIQWKVRLSYREVVCSYWQCLSPSLTVGKWVTLYLVYKGVWVDGACPVASIWMPELKGSLQNIAL